jgi:DNA mismatch endonuclease, patch repair protein
VFDRARRSQVMRAVRSKGNRSTELALVNAFRAYRITGWRRHAPIVGKPDFIFRSSRVAVFVDGCFWHGCPSCGSVPESNVEYWKNKISRNILRDRRQVAQLRARGWTVIRLWEHNAKGRNLEHCVRRIQKIIRENERCHQGRAR